MGRRRRYPSCKDDVDRFVHRRACQMKSSLVQRCDTNVSSASLTTRARRSLLFQHSIVLYSARCTSRNKAMRSFYLFALCMIGVPLVCADLVSTSTELEVMTPGARALEHKNTEGPLTTLALDEKGLEDRAYPFAIVVDKLVNMFKSIGAKIGAIFAPLYEWIKNKKYLDEVSRTVSEKLDLKLRTVGKSLRTPIDLYGRTGLDSLFSVRGPISLFEAHRTEAKDFPISAIVDFLRTFLTEKEVAFLIQYAKGSLEIAEMLEEFQFRQWQVYSVNTPKAVQKMLMEAVPVRSGDAKYVKRIITSYRRYNRLHPLPETAKYTGLKIHN